MLNKLETYYKEKGILSTSFTCKYKDQCQKNCPESKFTGPKSSYVGEKYEQRNVPRLLFLSLDSGSGNTNEEKRLPGAIRKQEMGNHVKNLKKNNHWYRTHELALKILRCYDTKILDKEEVKPFFAHVNSAKCSMNKKGNKKAHSVLFNNCQNYLSGELEILKPDIIVTQGDEAKTAIRELKTKYVKERDDKFYSIIELNGREIFWLHTYHPSAYGYFNKQRKKDWDKYVKEITKFIEVEVFAKD